MTNVDITWDNSPSDFLSAWLTCDANGIPYYGSEPQVIAFLGGSDASETEVAQ